MTTTLHYLLIFFLLLLPLPADCFRYSALDQQIIFTADEQTLATHCTLDELITAGRIFKVAGIPTQAKHFFHAALCKSPKNPHVNWDLGDLYLLEGDFKRGMAGFRARWENNPRFSEHRWEGEDLTGKKIAVFCQWGLGDTFMYLRYLKLLKNRGAHVICICQRPLKSLLSGTDYIDELIADGSDPLTAFDYQVPITYLPELFQTTIDTIPNQVPYLHVDQKNVDAWRDILAADQQFKVGLCWQGEKRADPQTLNRSVPLAQLVPLLQTPGVSFYSLQQGASSKEIDALPTSCKILLFDETFDKQNGAFVDTAAVMKQLDLVITIDTSIAHLAGALNVPVWVMLPFANEWRFFQHRTTSPWYPSMKLFRQSKRDEWHEVVTTIAHALELIMQKRGTK